MAKLRHIRFGGGLAVVLCTLLSLPSASLFINAEGGAPGSVTLTNRAEDSALVGMEWELYRVGFWNDGIAPYSEEIEQYGFYQMEGQFENFPVDLNQLSDAEWQNAAYTLENEAVVKNFAPDRVGFSDENGELRFEGIPDGLYLLSAKRLQGEEMLYTASPMLLDIEQEELHLDLNPEIHPLTEAEASCSVRIEWLNDAEFMEARGDSVIVYIYKDGWFYDTAELNVFNNWEFTWNGEANADWRVMQSFVPDGYTVAYQKDGTQFLIRNTYTPPPIEEPEMEAPEEETTPDPSETEAEPIDPTAEPIEETTESTTESTTETTTETTTTTTETTTTETTTTTESTTTTTETTTTTSPVTAPPASSSTTRRRRTSSSGAGVSAGITTTDSKSSGSPSGKSTTEAATASGASGITSANDKDAPPKTGQSYWLEMLLLLSGFVTVTMGWDILDKENEE